MDLVIELYILRGLRDVPVGPDPKSKSHSSLTITTFLFCVSQIALFCVMGHQLLPAVKTTSHDERVQIQ